MPSFPFTQAKDLSDIIIPLTETQATEIMDFLGTETSVYAAVYGPGFDGTPGKWSIRINRLNETHMLCYLNEYHPRKEGKADLIFRN